MGRRGRFAQGPERRNSLSKRPENKERPSSKETKTPNKRANREWKGGGSSSPHLQIEIYLWKNEKPKSLLNEEVTRSGRREKNCGLALFV